MNKNTYEFTKERYDEFIKEKKDNDIVISLGEIFDFDNNQISLELNNDNNYYINITTFFVSYYIDKPILIEKSISNAVKISKYLFYN